MNIVANDIELFGCDGSFESNETKKGLALSNKLVYFV